MKTISEIYNRITENLSIEHLKKISTDIITHYKNKQFSRLKKYALIIGIKDIHNKSHVFARLMKTYHPDKIQSILNRIEECKSTGNLKEMYSLYKVYFFTLNNTEYSEEAVHLKPQYRYDKEDFGYREKERAEDEDYGESNLDFDEDEFTFIDAVNKYFFGGLDHSVTQSDLQTLDGELNLSDYDIRTLNGIEYCIHLEELNLSNNRIHRISKLHTLRDLHTLHLANNSIESIEALSQLYNVCELDLSFNMISNIDCLLNLKKLEYINVIGNRLESYTSLEELIRRGVLVVYEDDCLL